MPKKLVRSTLYFENRRLTGKQRDFAFSQLRNIRMLPVKFLEVIRTINFRGNPSLHREKGPQSCRESFSVRVEIPGDNWGRWASFYSQRRDVRHIEGGEEAQHKKKQLR